MFRWWRRRKPKPAQSAGVMVTYVFLPPERKSPMQETVLTTIQKQRVRLTFRRQGAPDGELLPVNGVPSWEIDDPNIATLEPDADGLACTMFAGAPGIAIVTNVSQVQTPAGNREIVSQYKVTVNADGTVIVEYVFEDATDK